MLSVDLFFVFFVLLVLFRTEPGGGKLRPLENRQVSNSENLKCRGEPNGAQAPICDGHGVGPPQLPPFFSFLRAFWFFVLSILDKGGGAGSAQLTVTGKKKAK